MGDKALAIVLWAVVGAIGAFAGAGWVAARAARGRIPGALAGFLVGIVILLLIVGLGARPLLRVVDLHSVGIELGTVPPPDVEPPAGESRNELVEPQQGGAVAGNAVRTAVAQMQAAVWYLVAVLIALVGAAILGGIAGGHPPRRLGLDPRAAVISLAGLMALTAVMTVWLWPGVRATALALADMDQSADPDVGVNLTEVARHPEAMWGRTVTISGLIHRVLGPRTLLLGSDAPVVGDLVLVLGEDDLAAIVTSGGVITEGEVAQVTGRIRPLADSTLGGLPAESDGYAGQAVLVAEAVNLDVPDAGVAGDKEFSAGSDGLEQGVTYSDVVDDPDQYLGQTVRISAEVEEGPLTPHVFLLGDQDLLAISPEPRREVFVEATAYVTGEVRRFGLEELEQELGIDLNDARLRPHEGDPVIVVHAVKLVK